MREHLVMTSAYDRLTAPPPPPPPPPRPHGLAGRD